MHILKFPDFSCTFLNLKASWCVKILKFQRKFQQVRGGGHHIWSKSILLWWLVIRLSFAMTLDSWGHASWCWKSWCVCKSRSCGSDRSILQVHSNHWVDLRICFDLIPMSQRLNRYLKLKLKVKSCWHNILVRIYPLVGDSLYVSPFAMTLNPKLFIMFSQFLDACVPVQKWRFGVCTCLDAATIVNFLKSRVCLAGQLMSRLYVTSTVRESLIFVLCIKWMPSPWNVRSPIGPP